MLTERIPVRAKAHVLRLLGDQLIGNDQLAVFELVKNAYDADATEVRIIIEMDRDRPRIRVIDDGHGMTRDDIVNGWMVIGTDSKRGMRHGVRSPRFHRLPLGEKGVGRLAAFKLGSRIIIRTRAADSPEFQATLSLEEEFNQADYLEEVFAPVEKISPTSCFFRDNQTGTKVTILGVNPDNWKRGKVRDLQRMVNALSSPFTEMRSAMDVHLEVPGHSDWLADIPSVEDVLELATWRLDFSVSSQGQFRWTYRFMPPMAYRSLSPRTIRWDQVEGGDSLKLVSRESGRKRPDPIVMPEEYLDGVGSFCGTALVFFRRGEVVGSSRAIKTILDSQVGVRVYRDGMRVYSYGEPGDDWLGLNTLRILTPTERMGTKTVLAAVHLDSEQSQGLKEKTNREGFDENHTFIKFQHTVLSVLANLDTLRDDDRHALAAAIKRETPTDPGSSTFGEKLRKLEEALARRGLSEEFLEPVMQVRAEYETLRDVMLNSSLQGLNTALVFHELERDIRMLLEQLLTQAIPTDLKNRIQEQLKTLKGMTGILKSSRLTKFRASAIVQQARDVNKGRFNVHRVEFLLPDGDDKDFTIHASRSLVLGMLNNLIDNAIYWTSLRREEAREPNRTSRIAILLLPDWAVEGPALAVVDNGTGFRMAPEKATEPFRTAKPAKQGQGLGLYMVKVGMESMGGRLVIPGRDHGIALPHDMDGAVVVLLFKKG